MLEISEGEVDQIDCAARCELSPSTAHRGCSHFELAHSKEALNF
jgi:hypothetical protein